MDGSEAFLRTGRPKPAQGARMPVHADKIFRVDAETFFRTGPLNPAQRARTAAHNRPMGNTTKARPRLVLVSALVAAFSPTTASYQNLDTQSLPRPNALAPHARHCLLSLFFSFPPLFFFRSDASRAIRINQHGCP